MAWGQMTNRDEDQQDDGNSDYAPETTTEEIEESNVIRGFSGPKYVSKTESKKVIVEKTSLFGSEGSNEIPRQFIPPSQFAEPKRSSESYQRQSAPDSLFARSTQSSGDRRQSVSDSLFARTTQSSAFTNELGPTSNGFTVDCEHRSLFGSDFGGNNNLRSNSLFESHTNDDNHVFAGSFSTTESKKFSDPRSTDAYAGYMHKPTGSKVDVHASFTNSGTQVLGKGMYNINTDNALTGSWAVNQREQSWNSHGELAYQHKPTKSEVAVGVCNANGETDLTLRSRTKILRDRSNHAMDGSILVKQRVGGPLGVDANLDYKHTPSNTHLTVGVMHHNNATTVNTGINTKFKNKASLGASGYYTETPESKTVGFQVSGGF